ncbi:MAG TPA: hypothetical protein VFM68_00755 [Candidatus Saccharimonadales bacterium]|nr:hypothetical protein [Candidatus Saccharimonadales bacterium]
MSVMTQAKPMIDAALERLARNNTPGLDGSKCLIVTNFVRRRGPLGLRPIFVENTSIQNGLMWYGLIVNTNWDRSHKKYLGHESVYLSSDGQLAVCAKTTRFKKHPVLVVVYQSVYPEPYLQLILRGVELLGYDGHANVVVVNEPERQTAIKPGIPQDPYFVHHPLLSATGYCSENSVE